MRGSLVSLVVALVMTVHPTMSVGQPASKKDVLRTVMTKDVDAAQIRDLLSEGPISMQETRLGAPHCSSQPTITGSRLRGH
jgi:hypothetical protein